MPYDNHDHPDHHHHHPDHHDEHHDEHYDQVGCQHSRFGWVTPTRCSTPSSMAFSIESSGDDDHDQIHDNGQW